MTAVSHDKERYGVCVILMQINTSLRKLPRISLNYLKFINQTVWATLSHLTKMIIMDKRQVKINCSCDEFTDR